MNRHFLYILLLITPTILHAETEISPYRISGGATLSVLDDDKKESESLGYKAMIGYTANDSALLEIGYANFALTDENINPFLIELSWLYPISDFASLYFGGGGAFMDEGNSPTAKLGVQYQLDRNWYADVGYQGMFALDLQQDDLYSFNIMVGYKFDSKTREIITPESRPVTGHTETQIPIIKQPVDKVQEPVVVEPIAIEPIEQAVVKKIPRCEVKTALYQVIKGDHLYKIARYFNMSLEELLELNPKFENENRNLDLIYPDESIHLSYFSCE